MPVNIQRCPTQITEKISHLSGIFPIQSVLKLEHQVNINILIKWLTFSLQLSKIKYNINPIHHDQIKHAVTARATEVTSFETVS